MGSGGDGMSGLGRRPSGRAVARPTLPGRAIRRAFLGKPCSVNRGEGQRLSIAPAALGRGGLFLFGKRISHF